MKARQVKAMGLEELLDFRTVQANALQLSFGRLFEQEFARLGG